MPDDDPSVVAFAVLKPNLGIDTEDIAEGAFLPSELLGDVSADDLNAEALKFPSGHGDHATVGCLCGIHRRAVAKVEEIPSSRAWLHGTTINAKDAGSEIVGGCRIEAAPSRFGLKGGFVALHDIHEDGKHRVAVSKGQVIKGRPSQIGLEPFHVPKG